MWRNPLRYQDVDRPLPQERSNKARQRHCKFRPLAVLGVVLLGIALLVALVSLALRKSPTSTNINEGGGPEGGTLQPAPTAEPASQPQQPLPTQDSAPVPVPKPRPPFTTNILVDKGACGVKNDYGLACEECQGDCETDDDCIGDLLCFQRDDETPIPGCVGKGTPGKDYCYQPSLPKLSLREKDCTSTKPCKQCQGDCDSDNQCRPGLQCFERQDFESVPGCGGFGESGKDYCILGGESPNVLSVEDDCSATSPCSACRGPCFRDGDCEASLKCYRGGTPVPGCVSGPKLHFVNYCYQPPDEGPVTYFPGNLTVKRHGLLLSSGLEAKILATTGEPVQFRNGKNSTLKFHKKPDAGATFATKNGGWVYVSNSESSKGGVGALYFNKRGNLINYKMVANKSDHNCGGGKTWWDTWLTCEEKKGGYVWEVDPFGKRPDRKTLLGSGELESAAFYKTNFYVTEDVEDGALRRFTPDSSDLKMAQAKNDFSELLHSNSTGTARIEYLRLVAETEDAGTFFWTMNHSEARKDAKKYYSNSEGIDIARGIAYVTAKEPKILLSLNLEKSTWERSSTKSGAFNEKPDQIRSILGENAEQDILYFCEDGHDNPNSGVHGRDSSGRFYSIIDGPDYKSEVTGLAFSPDNMHMYISYQDDPGRIFAIRRKDGYPFGGTRLDIKYHSMDSPSADS